MKRGVKGNVKRCVFVGGMMFCVLLFSAGSGCVFGSGSARQPYFAEENQVKNYKDGEVSTFGLNIAPADEMGDWAVEWLADVTDKEGFQYYIYTDPDSWDVYLYYPKEQTNINALTNRDVAVEFSDCVLKVYVAPQDGGSGDVEDGEKCLLHFAAPPVFYAEAINVPLLELLKANCDSQLIAKYCNGIEQMWQNGDESVKNVVDVTILEGLSDDSDVWQKLGQYISSDFRMYINRELLKQNCAMWGVEQLK